ncbi:energy-coupled thiamine transporter ThiT [Fructobacillus parabroussonetiae]|uniref:Energy-coupled thiamine transporter ThiT n=1 Tax=Fructobacillus parabroussonetiae TaxID=2713174 RepID=A0ABS5QVX6_9LACO|nr:energy-coupled thiamine transporter ThiT [Fructobacillus parabroussonetiae]MBS9337271.1 energy-coupled thiamine transporter ThiT [Fructobacillus parabroussonetiae]MCK8617066.1 energy-coupled thiamine transporter ThiT [Fructobacillus parabroussonetiae]
MQNTKSQNLRFITEVALFTALSVVLSFWSLRLWGEGGSISFQMVPTMIIAYRYGYKGGLTVGFLFGMIKLILGAYILTPVQAFMDYPLAFTVVGFTALTVPMVKKAFTAKKLGLAGLWLTIGVFIGSFLRFLAHLLSAVIFFGQYAPKGESVWLYSIFYNGSYMLPSFIASAVVLLIIARVYPKMVTVA